MHEPEREKGQPVVPQQLTVVTRQRLLDLLVVEKVWWWGALDEVKFLERLYDLDALEGDGYRRPTAREDIWNHCINNDDWPPDWVFTDARFGLSSHSPQPLLNFLAEMLHPVVRRDPAEVESLAKKLNDILTRDGFELYPTEYISGLPVYSGGPCASFHGVRPDMKFESRPLLTDLRVLHEHQERIRAGLERDPAAAIASCKELVESLCKIILDHQNIEFPPGEDLPPLFKRVTTLLGLNADAVADHAKASATVVKILRTLTTTVQGLAELRNQLGLGHGRATPSPALTRHARLALNSTVTVTEFVLDTWQDRIDRGKLPPRAEDH
ncbi:abortive infection family protein [Streptomyces sp. NPDC048489]|uniref:abortive infection family protein n=1 Tax=Streptomyces sp. NPDC048489 TaxID=3154504 RepID=UPI003441B558